MKKLIIFFAMLAVVLSTNIGADDFTQKLNHYSQAQQHKLKADYYSSRVAGSIPTTYAAQGTLEALLAIYHQNEEIIKLLKNLDEKTDKQKQK